MILIDNYDSFTYNIVQYLRELGIEPKVFENDKITIDELKQLDFNSIIISPGAGNPDTAGISMDVIKEFYKTKKILGICLGHQCIAQFFGGKVVKSQNPTHGKTSKIFFDEQSKLFKGLPQGFEVTRYHSLEVKQANFPRPLGEREQLYEQSELQMRVRGILKITAQTSDGTIMAIEHETLPIYGVQFHPEAILTQYGHELLANFINQR